MPSTAIQHRNISGKHHNCISETPRKTTILAPARYPSGNPENVIPRIAHIENTTNALYAPPLRQSALATTIQFLLLLQQISPAQRLLLTNTDSELSIAKNFLDSSVADFPVLPAPFQFPAAAAAPAILQNDTVQWNEITRTLALTGENKVKELFTALKDYYVASGQQDADEGEDYELDLRIKSANYPVVLIPLGLPPANTTRVKRALEDKSNPAIAEHIKINCAFEEEILSADGENAGKILLVQAQDAENPMRSIYIHKGKDTRPTPEERAIANVLNGITDVITIGIKPFITNIIAATKRKEYFEKKGDDICTKRQEKIIMAEVSTFIDPGSLPYNHGIKIKPKGLRKASSKENNSAWYYRNSQSGVYKEVLLKLNEGKGKVDDEGREVFLKPTGKDNEFVTWHPHAVDPKRLERRVIVDPDKMEWHYADSFDTDRLNVEILEGRKYIKLHEVMYELHMNKNNKYEIVSEESAGGKKYTPVYMEPLSKTWHMRTNNGLPVFNKEQERVIDSVKSAINEKHTYIQTLANNPQRYGSGKIFKAEKSGDESHNILGEYIEMGGELIRVEQKATPKHGVRYEISGEEKFSPIEWDGFRWVFEKKTSPHVSSEVETLVTSNMFAKDIDASKVSASDNHGLKWDKNNNCYLKINNRYIKINILNLNRFSLRTATRRITLRFKNNKYFREKISERLNNILITGLNGDKRENPVDILKDIDGFSEESAKKLLSGYDFPEDGVCNGRAFALHIEQTGEFPFWAKRFRKTVPDVQQQGTVTETITVKHPYYSDRSMELHLGNAMGEGSLKNVYADADDNTFIIKKFSANQPDTSINNAANAMTEAENFNKIYGQGAALVFYDANNNYYVRMYNMPGIPLSSVPEKSLPPDVEETFVDILEIIKSDEKMNSDLTAENLHWDASTKNFYLVPTVKKASDTAATPLSLASVETQQKYWMDVINDLSKKKSPTEDPPAIAGTSAGKSTDANIAIAATSSQTEQALSSNDRMKMMAELLLTKDRFYARLREKVRNSGKNMSTDNLYRSILINQKIDRIFNIVKEVASPQLQSKRLLRLQELMVAAEYALNNGETISAVEMFIERNRSEVTSPGLSYSIHAKGSLTKNEVKFNDGLYGIGSTKTNPASRMLLHPENREIALAQHPFNAKKYTEALRQLNSDEKNAFKAWTAIPFDSTAEYASKIANDGGALKTGQHVSDELNRHLKENKELTSPLQKIHDDMMSAIEKNVIPPQHGEYMRTEVFPNTHDNPWVTGKIKPGDYVCNLRQFMDVAPDASFAQFRSMASDTKNNIIINYRIHTKKGPISLVSPHLAPPNSETTYLYKPDTIFKVIEYSIREKIAPLRFTPQQQSNEECVRVGVILDELRYPPPDTVIKVRDMFSGEEAEIKIARNNNKPRQ